MLRKCVKYQSPMCWSSLSYNGEIMSIVLHAGKFLKVSKGAKIRNLIFNLKALFRWIFTQNSRFQKQSFRVPSECQIFWIKIWTNVLSGIYKQNNRGSNTFA